MMHLCARTVIITVFAISIHQTTGQLCSELELFNCPNNTCISEHLVCDGKSDCAGGNDELKDLCLMIDKRNAKELCNGVRHFSCLGNPCLPIYKVCDEVRDCIYGTDERASVCGRTTFGRFVRSDQHSSGSGIGSMCRESKPKISPGIQNITKYSGSNISLVCVANLSCSSFVWKTTANGINITLLNPSEYQGNCKVTSSLQLINVNSNYNGEYSCTAISVYGNDTSTAYVHIKDVPSCMNPEVTVAPTNITVTLGANATLSCSACNTSGFVGITWFSPQLSNVTPATPISTSRIGNVAVSSLQLLSVDASFQGSYWCAAKYMNTTTTTLVNSIQATLTIIVPPLSIQTVSNQTALENSDVTFVCNASGAGPLTYYWKRLVPSPGSSDIAGANSSIMIIHSVQISDTGKYQCTVTDVTGQNATSNPAMLEVSADGIISTVAIATAIGATIAVIVIIVIAVMTVVVLNYRTANGSFSMELQKNSGI